MSPYPYIIADFRIVMSNPVIELSFRIHRVNVEGLEMQNSQESEERF